MALPATGSTITMSDIRTFFVFEGEASSYTLGILGTYIGIAQGTTISMSATFGGLENSQGGFFLLNEYSEPNTEPQGQLSGSFISLCLDTWPGQTGSNLGVMYALGDVSNSSTINTGLVKCNGGGTITTYAKPINSRLLCNPSMYAINGTKYLIVENLSSNSTLRTFNSSGTETNSFSLGWEIARDVFFYNKSNDRFYACDLYNGAGGGRGVMKRYTLSGTNDANIAFPTPSIGSGTISAISVNGPACVVPGMNAIVFTGYFTRSSIQYFFVYMFDGATDTWYKLVEGRSDVTFIPGDTSGTAYTTYSSNCVMSHDRRYIAVEMEYYPGSGTFWYRCFQKPDGDWTNLSAPLVKEGDQLWDTSTYGLTNNFKILDAFYGANGGVFVSNHYQLYTGFTTQPGRGRVFDFETGTLVDSLGADQVPEWNIGTGSKWPFLQSQRDITTTNQIKNVGGNFYQYGYATSRYEFYDPYVRYEMIVPLPNT